MMRKQTRKGMTLIEIVIALAIAAILGLLMVEIMNCVNATMRTTDYLNKRLAHEAKYADNLMTQDESGAFANQAATITIRAKDGGFTDIVADGVEYTAHYANPNELSDYITNTNYRFMVFNKSAVVSPTPKDVFWVRILVNTTTQIDQITQIEINGNCYSHTVADKSEAEILASGVVTSDLITASDVDFSTRRTNGTHIIDIPVPGGVDGQITVKLYKDMTTDKGNARPNHLFNTATLKYCTQATSPGGTTQYYDQVFYGFDGANWVAGDKASDVVQH